MKLKKGDAAYEFHASDRHRVIVRMVLIQSFGKTRGTAIRAGGEMSSYFIYPKDVKNEMFERDQFGALRGNGYCIIPVDQVEDPRALALRFAEELRLSWLHHARDIQHMNHDTAGEGYHQSVSSYYRYLCDVVPSIIDKL